MLIFIFAIFTFFLSYFRPWSLVAYAGAGGREEGGQNSGLRVKKREGGVREAEKRAGRSSQETWREPRLKGAGGEKFVARSPSLSVP